MSKESGIPIAAPTAVRRPKRLRAHGHERVDPYYWMRERDDPEVVRHLERENAYAEALLEPWQTLRRELIDEMASRIIPSQSSVPYRDGDYLYYHRYEAGQEYPLYCRRLGDMQAPEELLLDANAMAAGSDYFALRGFSVAPDHKTAVFAVDREGRRFYSLYFLDLERAALVDDRIDSVTSNTEWANDGATLLYTRQHPESLRDYQVLRHRLGAERDTLVYQEDDPAYWVGVEKSLSGRTLFVVSAATTSTEVRTISADAPAETPRVFLEREPGHEYFVTDGVDRYFVLTNRDAVNFRVCEAPLERTEDAAWQELIPERADVLIDGLDVFAEHIVLSVIDEGLDQLEVVGRATGDLRRIDTGEAVSMAYTHDNFRYRSRALRFSYTSLTTPETTCDYDFDRGISTLIRREEVGGGFAADDYRTERRHVRARDGVEIPVTLAYRDGALGRAAVPLLLCGYGAYGINSTVDFDSEVVSLLDRGFVYAIAHVRGGSERGRRWYYAGRQREKENTFNDFVDVARHLVEAGITAPDRCYAAGGSAGGLLMGVVANRAAELFHGMIANVPFVDVLTTMLDESIPLTTGEYEEWGDPRQADAYAVMAAYSPYDNVMAQQYPALLVTAGLHDSQVQYWEPAKWVAKLRETADGQAPILLKTDMGAGHSGKTGRYRGLEDTALEYTFLLMLEERRQDGAAAAAGRVG